MKELFERLWFSVKVILDKDTPTRAKVMLILAILYLLSPFDIFPDFSLGIGQFDDLVLIPFFFYIATKMVPQTLRNKYRHPRIS